MEVNQLTRPLRKECHGRKSLAKNQRRTRPTNQATGRTIQQLLHADLQRCFREANYRNRQCVLSLFAGTQGLDHQLRSIGHPVLSIDIINGEHHDLRKKQVFDTIWGWLNAGIISAVFSATPCNSMSKARRAPAWSKMPHKLRSPEQPHGIKGLSAKDAATLSNGNCLSKRANAIIRRACERGIPGMEENPWNSYLFQCHGREKRDKDPRYRTQILDQCQYGANHKKRTRIDMWKCPDLYLFRDFAKTCSGTRVCSRTGRPHERLTGLRNGAFLTTAAAHYPTGLSQHIAEYLNGAIDQTYMDRYEKWLFPWN